MTKAAPKPRTPITPADLENKLKAFQGDIQGKVDSKRNTLVSAGIGIGALLLIMMFLMGKRAGKKKSTIVEIKRI
jgi:hypothetical protein